MSKRTITGTVTSTAGDKTIVVTLTRRETHPLYGKKFTRSRKFHAHDAKNVAHVGDMVLIEECPPISRTKTWTLAKIIEHGREKLELKETEVEAEVNEAERRATAHEVREKETIDDLADELTAEVAKDAKSEKPVAKKEAE